MADSLRIKYCSNPDGHAPKDCPDFPKDLDEQKLYQMDKDQLAVELENMDIFLDEDELAEKIHDGSLWELM